MRITTTTSFLIIKMLIRSSSTPILKSWVSSHSVELSSEPDFFHHHIPKSQSISLTTTTSFSSSHSGNSPNKITRARSENDLRDLVVQKRNSFNQSLNKFIEDEDEEEEEEQDLKKNSKFLPIDGLFSSSGLDDELVEEVEYVGGGIGSNGGKCSGGGGDGFSDFNKGNDETDAYYQKMIESNPGNGLLLGNYAKFLKEVRGDLVKAEEYCERAILVNPNDANVLSLYADLIWQVHKDASRAEKYFDQAVQAEPNDCYVMASYARFLWDAEEDEEEEEEEKKENESCDSVRRPPDLFQGVAIPTVAAY